MHMTNIHEAKTHFSKLIESVANGEEVIIAKSGKPVAKLVPFKATKITRKPGSWRGKVIIRKDFDTLPDDLLKNFNGED